MKSKCGLVLPDTVMFCPACGEKFASAPPSGPEVEGEFRQKPSDGSADNAARLGNLLHARAREPRPVVPKDWSKRPGIFSGMWGRLYDPWGNFGDVRKLFAYGMVAEGRELMERIVQATERTPHFEPAVAALCFDLLRPPTDFARSKALASMTSRCESGALAALAAADRGDADAGPAALMDSTGSACKSAHGAFIWLMAWLAWCDVYLQVQILHPLGRTSDSAVVVAPLKGYAQLMLRQHENSWASFQRCVEDPQRSVDGYRDALGVSIGTELEAKLSRMLTAYSSVGLALVMWDLCFDAESEAAAREASRSLEGFPRQACRTLAGLSS